MTFIDSAAGGTFDLYSLICRHAKVRLFSNRQVADEALSTYKFEHRNKSGVKLLLEKHKSLLTNLLFLMFLTILYDHLPKYCIECKLQAHSLDNCHSKDIKENREN